MKRFIGISRVNASPKGFGEAVDQTLVDMQKRGFFIHGEPQVLQEVETTREDRVVPGVGVLPGTIDRVEVRRVWLKAFITYEAPDPMEEAK